MKGESVWWLGQENALWRVGCWILLVAMVFALECGAQEPPTGVRPGDQPLPSVEPGPPEVPDVTAPSPFMAKRPCEGAEPIPQNVARAPRGAPPRLSAGIAVLIKSIEVRFIDSKEEKVPPVISEDELRKEVFKNCEGKMLNTEHLIELRNSISGFYYKKGFVNSGAVIPDQDVSISKGIMVVDVIQGSLPLDNITIERPVDADKQHKNKDRAGRGEDGARLKWLFKSYVKDRVAQGVETPLDIFPLQERLQLLLRDPAIDNLQARLEPGEQLGDSRLDVEVTEAPLFRMNLVANNDRPISVGEYQGVAEARVRDVLGFGDPLVLLFSMTEGLTNGYFSYEVPLAVELPFTSDLPFVTGDLRAFVVGEITDADVVEEPFNILDIRSETKTIEFGLRYPIYKAITHPDENTEPPSNIELEVWEKELALSLSFARRHSKTYLLGRPFSFSDGVQDGESDLSVLRLAQNGFLRSENQVFVGRSTFSFGLPVLGATINENGPDGEFFAWLGQAQYAHRVPLGDRNSQLIIRGDVQLSDSPLLPIEQYSVGGLNTVRGYRRNQLVRDSGWVASAEWQVPVFQLPVPGLSKTPDDGWFWLAPFFDGGGGWNIDRFTPEPDAIYSVGAGVLWRPSRNISAEVYYGYGLTDVLEPEDKGLQDYGIYFNVRVGFDFDPSDIAHLF